MENIKILEMVCPNNGKTSENAFYPKSKYPKDYSEYIGSKICQTRVSRLFFI